MTSCARCARVLILFICSVDLIIRIFNDSEVRIENSVTRVIVWHHEACRVMANSYPE